MCSRSRVEDMLVKMMRDLNIDIDIAANIEGVEWSSIYQALCLLLLRVYFQCPLQHPYLHLNLF